jgi:hypothetical protein
LTSSDLTLADLTLQVPVRESSATFMPMFDGDETAPGLEGDFG